MKTDEYEKEGVVEATEATSLPVHVAACAERYRSLFNRMGRIERILIVAVGAVLSLVLTIFGVVIIALVNRSLGL